MMNNELRPYEAYKPTNLPWLDEIPVHWSLSRNKNVMIQNKALVGLNHAQYKLLSLTLNGVIARDMVNPKGKFPKEFDTYQVVSEKNLVFCLFDIDETPRTVGISPMDGMITGAYTVFKVANANERFLYYYYLSIDNNKMLKPLYTGLRKVISADTFLRTKLPIPPRPEQDQIVKYLDHQLFKINKFVKAKKKLIAVLKEQKQAIINEAVTKGLDPNVKMKPSGVEWLGDVPEHWEVKCIKHLFYCLNNKRVPLSSSERGLMKERNYDYYGASGVIDRVDNYIYDDDLLLIAEDGANLVSRNLKLSIIARGKFWVNNHAHILKPVNNSLEFMAHLLETIDYRPLISGAAQPKLTKEKLLNIKVCVPRIEEQINIVEYINIETKIMDEVIAISHKEIDLLTEYKNSLIADVVTGKMDIRHLIISETEKFDLEDLELDEDSLDTEEILEDEEGDE